MNMKKLAGRIRKTIGILLTATMLFSNLGMTALASENILGEEIVPDQILPEENLSEEVMAEEILSSTEEKEETTQGEQIEESEMENFSINEVSEEMEEQDTEENRAEEESSIIEESSVAESGTTEGSSVGESSTTEESSIAKMSGVYGDITWKIDDNGKLTVYGSGEISDIPYNGIFAERAPWYENREKILSAEIDISGMTNAFSMFRGCSNLKSVDFKNFDTSRITDMGAMFRECSSLTDVDVSGFETGNVTSMNGMFWGCSSLTTLDVSNFDTGNVKNFNNMFKGCNNITSLDVSGFNTQSATKMGVMFADCNSLTSLDVSGFHMEQVTEMGAMFRDCNSLSDIDVSNFNTSNAINMNYMFKNCSNLTTLDVHQFDTSSVVSMQSMFSGCSNLTALDVSGFITSNVTTMQSMFSGCNRLNDLDLSSFDMINVTDMKDLIFMCDALKTIYTPRNVSLSAALPEGIWYDAEGTEYTELPTNLNGSILLAKGERPAAVETQIKAIKEKTDYKCGITINLDDLQVIYYGSNGMVRQLEMDEYTTNIEEIDIFVAGEKNLTIKYDNGEEIITTDIRVNISENCGQYGDVTWNIDKEGKLTVTGVGEYAAPPESEDAYWTRAPWYESREIILSAEINLSGITNTSCMFRNCSNLRSVDVKNFDTSQVTNMESMFEGCSSLEDLDTSGFHTQNVILMDNMFKGCSSLKKLDVSGFDTANVTWMARMFSGCSSLESIDVSGFDTSQTGKLNEMFMGCSSLKNVDVSGFNTETAIDMHCMFQGCSSLESLDLSSFDTRNVTNMRAMFEECSRLEILDLSSFDIENVQRTDEMFCGCSNVKNLILGSGFSMKNATSAARMFRSCSSLESLDLSSFDTGNVTEMQHMFRECSNLKRITFGSNFNTGNVTNMLAMFRECSSLESLDLSGFNTENVTEMRYLFKGCKSLTSLDLSSFCTENITEMKGMFAQCEKLTSLNLSNLNVKNVTDMSGMFTACDALMTINTPLNVSIVFELPEGTWRDAQENIYTELPTDRNAGILLTREKNKIMAVKTKTVYSCGEPIDLADLRVTYYGTGGTIKILENSNYTTNITNIDTSEPGEKVLTITYYNEKETLTAYIKLTVTQEEQSGVIEESSTVEESGSIEESSAIEESGSIEESSAIEESSSIEESSAIEESSGIEESDTDKDDSLYGDSERTDLESLAITVSEIKSKVYDGNAYEPAVKVTAKVNGKKITLTEGADYRILYKNNVNAGIGTVILRGNGIYKGEIREDFIIAPKPMRKLKIAVGSISGNVSGDNLSGLPVYVYDGAKLLEFNKDYILSDYDLIRTSSAQVIVSAAENSNYEGKALAKFTVYESGEGIISSKDIELVSEIMPYTGKAVKPEVTVTLNGTTLTKKDYKVQYQNNKNAGTAFVVVTGKGKYKGKATIPFTIKAEEVESNAIAIKAIPEKTYNAKMQKPSITVSVQKDGKAKKLSKNKDYIVSYKNNFHAGTATVTVTGIGNYVGMVKTIEFTIQPQNIKKTSIRGTQENLTLMYEKRKLKEGSDYEKPIYGAVKKNKVEVTIKGKGDFTGEVTKCIKK